MITVSIVMITYNHQDYIKQAIEGVLMQDTNFNIELIISNDCSTDGTSDCVKNIKNTHPKGHLITYFDQKKNMGMMSNFIFALKQCQGSYVAICDGDDYWTDPLKLQKQVGFLEKNTNVNICFHRAQILSNNTLKSHDILKPFIKKPFNYIELLKQNNFIVTASVMFRKPKNFKFPNWFNQIPFGDMGLYKLVAQDSQIQCLDEIMCVYRVHSDGVYSGLNVLKARRNYLNFYQKIYIHLNSEEQKVVKTKIEEKYREISKLKFKKSKYRRILYYAYLRVINLFK
ncbi:glycosyltransferase family 2 protein [Psychroserpens luteus]|uniref:Glycosyltransferase family 2 protein n=1 Tax=Psychroserpens luteus TaxID=1434066 RepID=A0ABW5ZX81_9FLAO|nr:glycosyltransferase [Psychroserpens luteus]